MRKFIVSTWHLYIMHGELAGLFLNMVCVIFSLLPQNLSVNEKKLARKVFLTFFFEMLLVLHPRQLFISSKNRFVSDKILGYGPFSIPSLSFHLYFIRSYGH